MSDSDSDSDSGKSFFSTVEHPDELVHFEREKDLAEIARLKRDVGKLRSLNQQGKNSPSKENTMFSTLSQRMTASAAGREQETPPLSQRMTASASGRKLGNPLTLSERMAAAAAQQESLERENTLPLHSSMLSQRMAAAAASPEQIDQEDSEFWGESSSSVQNPELESLRKELILDRMDAENEERQFWDARDREVPAGFAPSAPSAPSALPERSNKEMKEMYAEERRRAMALRAAAAAAAAAAPAAAAAAPVVPTEKKGFFSKLFKRGGKHTHRRKKSKSALSRKNFKRYSVKGKRRNLRKSRR